MRKLLYLLYLAEAALLIWSINRVIVPGQTDAVITAYLAVVVGIISAFIAQTTFHFSLYQQDRASKANAPYVLIVGRRFDLGERKTAWSGEPEFAWEDPPTEKGELPVRYGFLNRGEEVIVRRVYEQYGLFGKRDLKWETLAMTQGTAWRPVSSGRSYREIPYATTEAVRSTPMFSTWLNVLATYGNPIVIWYINPATKDEGKIRILPEELHIASAEFQRKQRHQEEGEGAAAEE